MGVNYAQMGRNIQKLRKEQGLTQEKLGDMVNCSESHIGHIENGKGIPSLDITDAIARTLGVTIDYLINGLFYTGSTEDETAAEFAKLTYGMEPSAREHLMKLVRAYLHVSHEEERNKQEEG